MAKSALDLLSLPVFYADAKGLFYLLLLQKLYWFAESTLSFLENFRHIKL